MATITKKVATGNSQIGVEVGVPKQGTHHGRRQYGVGGGGDQQALASFRQVRRVV